VIRIALLLSAAFLLAMPASADIARPVSSGFIVAATQGQTSVTGTTAETSLASLRIPAGSMGKNGHIEVKALWSYTNSTNNKTLATRWAPTAGGIVGVPVVFATTTTTATGQTLVVIRNNNATNAQNSYNATAFSPFGSSGNANVVGAIDTTVDMWVNLTGALALSTETITLVHAYAVVFPSP